MHTSSFTIKGVYYCKIEIYSLVFCNNAAYHYPYSNMIENVCLSIDGCFHLFFFVKEDNVVSIHLNYVDA